MCDVEYGMGGKCKGKDGQRMSRITDHRGAGDDQEPDGECDLESHALHSIVRDCKAYVNTGRHSEKQRRELSEPEF